MKTLVGLCVVTIFFSCNYRNEEKVEVKTLVKRINDSTEVAIKVRDDGFILDSVGLINGKKSGLRKSYDTLTGFTRYLNYTNGETFGVDSTVSKEGVTILNSFNFFGEPVGGREQRTIEGHMEYYDFVGLDSGKYYHRTYRNDTLVKVIGDAFVTVVDSESIVEGGVIKLRVVLAVPPDCESYFIICERPQKKSKCYPKGCCELYNVEYNGDLIGDYFFKYNFKQKGKVSLKYKYLLIDNKTQKEELTSKEYDYFVK